METTWDVVVTSKMTMEMLQFNRKLFRKKQLLPIAKSKSFKISMMEAQERLRSREGILESKENSEVLLMGCDMACSCSGGQKGVPRTRVVTPSQLNARRTGLGIAAPANNVVPAAIAPVNTAMTETSNQTGLTADRRAAEKTRRDILRNKLGR